MTARALLEADLPQLPKAYKEVSVVGLHDAEMREALEDYYTADQMRAYAHAAIASSLEGQTDAVAILRDIQFSNRGYCPRCCGWTPKGQGETPGKHTKDCDLAKLIRTAQSEDKP